MQYFIDNPEETDKYRTMAVKRIREHYNWDDVVSEYEKFFVNMLQSWKSLKL
jgi:glycosyltransferase involved in cell wall biosynthesis